MFFSMLFTWNTPNHHHWAMLFCQWWTIISNLCISEGYHLCTKMSAYSIFHQRKEMKVRSQKLPMWWSPKWYERWLYPVQETCIFSLERKQFSCQSLGYIIWHSPLYYWFERERDNLFKAVYTTCAGLFSNMVC